METSTDSGATKNVMQRASEATSETAATEGGTRIGSIVISAMFIALGALTLFDTMSYSDMDSKVFPRAAAIVLIITASIALLMSLFQRPSEAEGFGRGSWWRRLLLIVTLLLACMLMSRPGFLIASTVAFTGALIAANHDRWQPMRTVLYAASGAIVVGGFYSLFKFGLNVPLP